ncbi:glycosyltransferase [Desulfocurvibacter africanus PCS]|uniref:Glycosyltransferase n=1 Tax=Desulfocurvibacter africanus PCS TaxID=1262666 RepID=M5PT56_DESAF|nr:glycosyltransferase [Desulfocurvibacter africanus]EMG37532.1 glycosyltransferase [Desulfocurvibacter africanus PCS]
MRVLHLGKYYPPALGGMETFLRDLATAQVAQGLEVRVLAHAKRPWRLGSREVTAGVEVRRAAILGQLAFAPLAPGYPMALAGLLADFRPQVIHAHLPNTSAFALLGLSALPEAIRPALVLHWHSDVVTDGSRSLARLYPLYRVFEQALLRRADAVVATSEPYLQASDALAAHRAKCRVISLGLDPLRLPQPSPDDIAAARAHALQHVANEMRVQGNHFPGGRESERGQRPLSVQTQIALGNDGFLVLAAGRFSHYKGFEVLVRAAGLLPERVRVVIAGDGPLRRDLLRLAQELGVEDRVSMPGSLPEAQLHALMAGCDCFCLPSVARSEAFGLVLAEAMRFGRPLIASRLTGSGMGVLNEEGVTGLAFEPGDALALASAVRRLMDDACLRESLGRAGRERFETRLHIAPVSARMTELYRELTARARRRPQRGGKPAA